MTTRLDLQPDPGPTAMHAEAVRAVAAIKTATRNAFDLLGGYDATAAIPTIRYARSYLAECANRNSERILPLDVAIELDRLVGEPILLSAYARLLGFTVTPIADGQGCIASAMTDVVRGGGRVAAETVSALSDGIVDDRESEALTEALTAQQRTTEHALRVLRARRHGPRVAPAA